MDTEQLNKYLKSIGYIFIFICIACIALAIVNFNPIGPVQGLFTSYKAYQESETNLKAEQQNYDEAKASEALKKNKPKIGEKTIFEPTGIQLGGGASFAEPFEEMIDVARDSKIRIKSIKYNYSPDKDPIVSDSRVGYNACEMTITAIGTYAQLKSFFGGMLAKPYLTRITNIRIEPWGFDRSILIAYFGLTLYTHTGK